MRATQIRWACRACGFMLLLLLMGIPASLADVARLVVVSLAFLVLERVQTRITAASALAGFAAQLRANHPSLQAGARHSRQADRVRED